MLEFPETVAKASVMLSLDSATGTSISSDGSCPHPTMSSDRIQIAFEVLACEIVDGIGMRGRIGNGSTINDGLMGRLHHGSNVVGVYKSHAMRQLAVNANRLLDLSWIGWSHR